MNDRRNIPPANVFEALRRLRACNKQELAAALGIDRKTLREWESDPEQLHQKARERLAALMLTTLRAAKADDFAQWQRERPGIEEE